MVEESDRIASGDSSNSEGSAAAARGGGDFDGGGGGGGGVAACMGVEAVAVERDEEADRAFASPAPFSLPFTSHRVLFRPFSLCSSLSSVAKCAVATFLLAPVLSAPVSSCLSVAAVPPLALLRLRLASRSARSDGVRLIHVPHGPSGCGCCAGSPNCVTPTTAAAATVGGGSGSSSNSTMAGRGSGACTPTCLQSSLFSSLEPAGTVGSASPPREGGRGSAGAVSSGGWAVTEFAGHAGGGRLRAQAVVRCTGPSAKPDRGVALATEEGRAEAVVAAGIAMDAAATEAEEAVVVVSALLLAVAVATMVAVAAVSVVAAELGLVVETAEGVVAEGASCGIVGAGGDVIRLRSDRLRVTLTRGREDVDASVGTFAASGTTATGHAGRLICWDSPMHALLSNSCVAIAAGVVAAFRSVTAVGATAVAAAGGNAGRRSRGVSRGRLGGPTEDDGGATVAVVTAMTGGDRARGGGPVLQLSTGKTDVVAPSPALLPLGAAALAGSPPRALATRMPVPRAASPSVPPPLCRRARSVANARSGGSGSSLSGLSENGETRGAVAANVPHGVAGV